jgi:octaprenyl-diphosphate synthase
VGKPTGNDIKEKKVTLPLIYTLNKVDKTLRKDLIYIIKNQNRDKEKINFVISKVEEAGGISYATEKMNEYRNSALKILEDFPADDTRNTLADLVNFTTDRKK